MYRILIVDDDLPVRMELRSLFDWDKYGLELTEDAMNGMEALERVKQYNPHIIILDLGMPLMNGLQVLGRLKEEKCRGKVIVLSCHDDFDSVSEALKMGAIDYILKHKLSEEKLMEAIEKAEELLEQENSEQLEQERLNKLSELNLQLLKDDFIKELIVGNQKDQNRILEMCKKLDSRITFKKFIIAVVEVDELYILKGKYSKSDLRFIMKSVQDIVCSALNGNDHINGCIEEGKYCIAIDFDQNRSFMNINREISELCERILENMKGYLNLHATIGLSRICQDANAIDDCYSQAELALDGKMYLGGNRVIHFSEVENFTGGFDNFIIEYEGAIIQTAVEADNKIDGFMKHIFHELKSKRIKPEQIKGICFELLLVVNKLIKEYKLSNADIFASDFIPYNVVLQMETLTDIEEWFISICHKINRAVGGNIHKDGSLNFRPEIVKALEYIRKNYIKHISLQDIADYSELSRTYFSQLFKQETGENFIDYLNKYRIDRAKQLLKSSTMKVYAVGIECGFDNYRYFTKLFKDVCGVSPIDYREGNISSIEI